MAIKLKPLGSQVMVITGATSPIGLAVARAAGRAGARLMLIDAVEGALGEAVRAINNAGGVSDYAIADPHDAAAIAAAGHLAKARFGRVDSWVAVLTGGEDAHDWSVAVSLLRHEGGALIVLGATPTVGRKVKTLRAETAKESPRVAVVLIQPASPGADPQRIAEAILQSATRSRRDVSVGGAATPLNFAGRHPGIVVMVGLSGLALAAGGWRALRRRRSA